MRENDQVRTVRFCRTRFATLFLVALAIVGLGCGQSGDPAGPDRASVASATEFKSSSTVEETWRQHKALPDPAETIWWDVNGPDMLWNNKNLHQIVPTVNVYRDGPVRELAYQPMAEIAEFKIETPDGKIIV